MASFLAGLMARISEASRDPEKLPAALMSSGGILGAAALSLIIFKAPGGIFLRLHGSAPAYSYYGILIAVMVYGLAAASVGFWVVPRDAVGWHAAGKRMLWYSVLLLVLVTALGGLSFLK